MIHYNIENSICSIHMLTHALTVIFLDVRYSLTTAAMLSARPDCATQLILLKSYVGMCEHVETMFMYTHQR